MRVALLSLFVLINTALFAQNDTTWWKETTIYQIYPRSYADSDGDGIGDLRGIINKLDYIKEMGFKTIWISPFYESPQVDFGYDISNYYGIAPEYGTMATVDSLIAETHKRGLKIVFDLVMNHTSNQHPWFKESASSTTNPKADWYVWKDGKGKNGKRLPNNWYNVISQKGWHYSTARKQWFYTAFLSCQPDLNYRNPEVKKTMFNVVKHWMNSGVDGIRLDIFNCILEDPSFANNPGSLTLVPNAQHLKTKFQNRISNINHPDNIALAIELRDTIDKYHSPTRFMVGEAVGKTADVTSLVANGKGLNLVFLFDMIFYKYDAKFFRNKITEYEKLLPAPYMPTIVFGNHDNKRTMWRLKNNMQKMRQLALFQLTARGVPVIYYGEEIGMINASINKKDAQDIISKEFNSVPQWLRNKMPVPLNRDECRTPMQWDTSKNAGFSTATKTWLPVGPDEKVRNVKTEAADSASLLNTYKGLLQLRDTTEVFKNGSIAFPINNFETKKVLAYARINASGGYHVFINFSNKPQFIPAPSNTTYSIIYKLSATDKAAVKNNTKGILLQPHSGVIASLQTLYNVQ